MSIVINGSGSITGLSSGSGISANALSGTIPDANAPSGSVIQVVTSTSVSQITLSTLSYTNTGLSASITPLSSNSKVLAFLTINVDNQSTGNNWAMQLRRGGTNISPNGSAAYDGMMYCHNIGQRALLTHSSQTLDSPNSSSSITYELWGYPENGTVLIRGDLSATIITLMEIAA